MSLALGRNGSRRALRAVALLITSLLVWYAGSSHAQQYPSKTVRIVVPTAPGGGTDFVGRVLAQNFAEVFGQQFIVENRGGAGTTIGTAAVAKSSPDGYTLLLNHNSLAFNASYYRRLPYDTLKDLAPITLVATQPFLMVVHPSLPARSVDVLLSLARKSPGQIAYGSGGAGSGPYMSMELLKHAAGIDVLHVPYKGAGPAFVDLVAGQVQMMIATMSLALPHAKTGRVRPLAITSIKRHPDMPQLPTVAETIPNYRFEVWYGLFAPAGTPTSIIQRLNAAGIKVLESQDTRQKLGAQGLETTTSTPQDFVVHLKSEVETWAKVVKAIGQYAD